MDFVSTKQNDVFKRFQFCIQIKFQLKKLNEVQHLNNYYFPWKIFFNNCHSIVKNLNGVCSWEYHFLEIIFRFLILQKRQMLIEYWIF